MTESEALKKWCPMVNVSRNSFFRLRPVGDFEADRNPDGARCIGSACMLWRDSLTEIRVQPCELDGYCGLAGKP